MKIPSKVLGTKTKDKSMPVVALWPSWSPQGEDREDLLSDEDYDEDESNDGPISGRYDFDHVNDISKREWIVLDRSFKGDPSRTACQDIEASVEDFDTEDTHHVQRQRKRRQKHGIIKPPRCRTLDSSLDVETGSDACEISYEDHIKRSKRKALADSMDHHSEGLEQELTVTQKPQMRTKEKNERSDSIRSVGKVEDTKYPAESQCIRWFGHGKLETLIAVAFAWIAMGLSIAARQDLQFVQLKYSMDVAPLFQPINAIGLVNIALCFDETTAHNQTGCLTVILQNDEIDDTMYEVAGLFGSSSVVFGAFFTILLSTSTFWETIDLRPIGFGLLITYFLQSFTMLFFDADFCRDYTCKVGSGCILSIFSSVCWVVACIATAKMEAFKIRATRRRRRRNRRRLRRAMAEAHKQALLKKKIDLQRKESNGTEKTSSTSSSSSSLQSFNELLDEQIDAV